MSWKTCQHNQSDKAIVLVDGLCPLCMQEEIYRLVKVLLWYADEGHYLRGAPGENTPRDYPQIGWWLDNGQRARDALKGGEG